MNNLNKDDVDDVDEKKSCKTSGTGTQTDNFMSLIDFYESIPGKLTLIKIQNSLELLI